MRLKSRPEIAVPMADSGVVAGSFPPRLHPVSPNPPAINVIPYAAISCNHAPATKFNREGAGFGGVPHAECVSFVFIPCLRYRR